MIFDPLRAHCLDQINKSDFFPKKSFVFSDFQCVAEKCALSCCVGWNIALDKETYRQYKKNADLAQNITKKVHDISRSSQAFGTIKRNAGGECSMLTPEGLCSVQKSLGEKALSKTCGTFPRENVHFHNLNVRSFTTTCPEVARLTVASKEAMKLVDQPMAKKGEAVTLFSGTALFQATKKTFFSRFMIMLALHHYQCGKK